MHKPQLFCYTYAGGTASFFDDIKNDLKDMETIGFEYAGHGIRHREKYYPDFQELAEDAYSALLGRYNGGRYALFGYSMGCISLIEILKVMMREGMPLPNHVFLAAHEPLTRTVLQGLTPEELESWVKKRTIDFGAVPEKLIDNKAFWRTYLPIYCADYGIISQHRFEDVSLKASIAATIFYSEKDTPLSDMKLWEKYFSGKTDYYQFDGPHFFMKQYHREMAEVISQKIR